MNLLHKAVRKVSNKVKPNTKVKTSQLSPEAIDNLTIPFFRSEKVNNANEMILGLTNDDELFEYNIDDYRNMLVVGQPGCGKTVWFEQILLSMMLRNSPNDIKIGIIDFSGTQYIGYEGLPYMLENVVSDINKVKMLLERINEAVEYRQQAFIDNNVTSIKEYNAITDESDKFARWTIVVEEIHQIKQMDEDVFDLLIDLSSKIHDLSDVGIHFIVSFQQARLITEEQKQCFDLKASMRTHSRIDSEEILGESGAERLNASGDILIKCDERLARLQSSYISDTEKLKIFDSLKKKYDDSKV